MSVTLLASRSCEGCGGSLEGRRPQARTCSPKCRQKVSRQIRRKCDTRPKTEASAADRWAALREQEGLTDDELRRALADRVARARIAQPSVSEEDRRLFAEAERAEAEGAAA